MVRAKRAWGILGAIALVATSCAKRETEATKGTAPASSKDERAGAARAAPARTAFASKLPRGLGTMRGRAPSSMLPAPNPRLASHHVRAFASGTFARTEIEDVFQNETDGSVDGTYRFSLPFGAVLAKVALSNDGSWTESRVVETPRVGSVFRPITDDLVHPRAATSPEEDSSRTIALEIPAIPAHGSRAVRVTFDAPLVREADVIRYSLPLSTGGSDAAALDDLSIELSIERGSANAEPASSWPEAQVSPHETRTVIAYRAKNASPRSDFVASWKSPSDEVAVDTFGAGDLAPTDLGLDHVSYTADEAFVSLRTEVRVDEASAPRRALVLVLNASERLSGDAWETEKWLAEATLDDLRTDERFALLACDSACRSYPERGMADVTREDLDRAKATLRGWRTAGSYDLVGAIREATKRLPTEGPSSLAVLGRGAASSGELSAPRIASRVLPGLRERHADLRLIGLGSSNDDAAWRELRDALAATYQPFANGDDLAHRVPYLVASLRKPVARDVTAELPAALVEAFPALPASVVAGEEAHVVAKLARHEGGVWRVRGTRDGAPWSLERRVDVEHMATSAIVPRMWAAARLASLGADPQARSEIVALAQRFELPSPFTSILVGDAEVTISEPSRQVASASIAKTAASPASPLTSLGLGGGSARGASGGAAAPRTLDPFGELGRSPSTAIPSSNVSIQGNATTGKLSSAPRVLATVRPRARACYQRALSEDPSSQGNLRFVLRVSPSGSVEQATLMPSGTLSGTLAACVRSVLSRMSFGASDDGQWVTIAGSISFQTSGGSSFTASSSAPTGGGGVLRAATPNIVLRDTESTWQTSGEDELARLAAVVAKSPESRSARESQLRGELAHGRFDRAEADARSFVELDPDFVGARELLAYASLLHGDTAAALEALDTMTADDVRAARAHARAARAFEAAGDEARACAHFRSLAELEPTDAHLYESLACRARLAPEDREALLAELRSLETPGPLVTKLRSALEAGAPAELEPLMSRNGTVEISVECPPDVATCPLPVVIAPNGSVFSPLAPDSTRSSARLVSLDALREGAYRVLVASSDASAHGEVRVHTPAETRAFPFSGASVSSIASFDVTYPSLGARALMYQGAGD